MQAPLESLDNPNHRYWYIENETGEIIAALGVRENKYGSGGYEMDQDYVAVHKNYRKKGFAKSLLKEKVAEIPDYYVEGEGRIDYFKKL